jgi:asparagine synthase (glutamine-hydrolysing)
MCGITGIFDTRSSYCDINRAVLQRMNDSQLHRGPDEGSLHLEPGVGLGHRRLSIIDIATGQQPLFNEDGSVAWSSTARSTTTRS